MRISVIIPAFNEEAYIGPALDAVLAQDERDVEVIVIDNASTDGTAEIARRYPVTVLSENRKGTMWACETGRKRATGEVIVRMDADCVPKRGWLSAGAAHFTDPKVSAATGPYDYFDAPKMFNSMSLFTQKYIYRLTSWSLQKCHLGALLVGGNSFMRARALDTIGGFDTSLIFYGDDTDTAKRLATVGKVVFDPELELPTSARRFRTEGNFKLLWKYFFHFFKQTFTRIKKFTPTSTS